MLTAAGGSRLRTGEQPLPACADLKPLFLNLLSPWGAHPQVPALAEVEGLEGGHRGPGYVLVNLQVARAGHVQAPQLAEGADLGGQVTQAARAHRQQPQLCQLEQSLCMTCFSVALGGPNLCVGASYAAQTCTQSMHEPSTDVILAED